MGAAAGANRERLDAVARRDGCCRDVGDKPECDSDEGVGAAEVVGRCQEAFALSIVK